MELHARGGEEAGDNFSGSTDRTAAPRLRRRAAGDVVGSPNLELVGAAWSSWSDMTLQSSLVAPVPEASDERVLGRSGVDDTEWNGEGIFRIVACSESLPSSFAGA